MTKQSGFNLLEVMIALVVLSVGLLGLAAMQLNSLKLNQSAYMRSQATLLAYDIIDRMRANREAVSRGSYFNEQGVTHSHCMSYSGPVSGCSAAEMAVNDLAEWQTRLGDELANGAGRICRSNLAGDQPGQPDCDANDSANPVVVYIWWHDGRGDRTSPITQFAVSAQL
ncbi:type IV pilus modification protein PilV [Neptuniibacter halophilus]|uniref:type IV pilus modification protein PilV n=1 Tax=Neptuniibacter halophilus TaxID=651666 RepID=UPI0025722E02|nr:type IV pilus modification protein PilV [Neptuniibacter halophilus]